MKCLSYSCEKLEQILQNNEVENKEIPLNEIFRNTYNINQRQHGELDNDDDEDDDNNNNNNNYQNNGTNNHHRDNTNNKKNNDHHNKTASTEVDSEKFSFHKNDNNNILIRRFQVNTVLFILMVYSIQCLLISK